MFVQDSERLFAEIVNQMVHTNPFQRQRIARLERDALAIEMPAEARVPAVPPQKNGEFSDFAAIGQRAEGLAERCRQRLATEKRANERDGVLYRDLVLFVLYFRYRFDLQNSIEEASRQAGSNEANARPGRPRGLRIAYYERFAGDIELFLGATNWLSDPAFGIEHQFALMFQVRRAFHFIHAKIRGRSAAVERLRAMVWQSIFTHDMRRYDQSLHDRMHDITTLITGPSGTGKDLVAEAIGQSRYIRFDARKKEFAEDFVGAFHPVNLSAIPSELIEAELFGNCKGAFTGAVQDRVGWLEQCGPFHSVFLDEIGELAHAVQVKLLRVLQNRTFQRVGETTSRRFEGKVIAATNRDLDEEMRLGRFRRDFYYRLCSDRIRTPSLREQLNDDADELPYFVEIISRQMFGDAGESIAKEVVQWIEQNIPRDYAWPGNIRELEQCIRNVLVRNEYHPPRENLAPRHHVTNRLNGLQLTADELLSWYCTHVFAETGSYSETARRLKLDRRTVQRKIDNQWLESND